MNNKFKHLLDLPHFSIVKKFNFEAIFSPKLNMKREWICESEYSLNGSTTTWYTDGSKVRKETGTGGFESIIKYFETKSKYPSSFQVKIHTMWWSIQFNLDRSYSNQDIIILSNSRTAIKALSSPIASSKIVLDYLGKLHEIGKNKKVTLLWVLLVHKWA